VAHIYVLALCWPTGSTGARDESLHNQIELEVGQKSVMLSRAGHGDTAKSKLKHPTGNAEEDYHAPRPINSVGKSSRTRSPGRTEHTHQHGGMIPGTGNTSNTSNTSNTTATAVNISEFWQNVVPFWLGLGRFSEKKCAEEDNTNVNARGHPTGHDNWLSRLFWNVPIMFPVFFVILSSPFMFYFSSSGSSLREDFEHLVFDYAGFFVANWAVFLIMTPGFFIWMLKVDRLKFQQKHTMGGWFSFEYAVDLECIFRIVAVATGTVLFRVVATVATAGEEERKAKAAEEERKAKATEEERKAKAAEEEAAAKSFGLESAAGSPQPLEPAAGSPATAGCDHTSIKKIKPSNIYMNMNRPLNQVIVKFTGQSFLMWMYCAFLQDKAETKVPYIGCTETRMQFTFIVLLFLPILQLVVQAGIGTEFIANRGRWMALARSREFQLAGGKPFVTSRIEMFNRLMMDFCVNQVYRGIIVFTMQSVCLHDMYLDLVLNVFAVGFITTLDEEDGDVAEIYIIGDENGAQVPVLPLGEGGPDDQSDGQPDTSRRAGVRLGRGGLAQ